jgi:glycosyltransferase involved in cell wall biosynthesis
MAKVSVIIPVFNSAATLRESIDSVLGQTFSDFEVIIVDDGSTDNSRTIISEQAARFPGRIRYLYQANAGTAAARNAGIKEARGEYVALLDADDLWTPDKLQIQTSFMDDNPQYGFTYTETLVIDAHGTTIGHWKKRQRTETFECLYEQNFVYVLTVMIRKSCFDKVGLMDTNLQVSADYDLWLRLARHFSFKNIPLPLAKYRLHAGNISKNLHVRLRDNLALLEKPDISGHLKPSVRRRRRADAYMRFAGLFRGSGEFRNAGLCYYKACVTHPFVGQGYGPKGKSHRLATLPYRIARPYLLALSYIALGLLKKSRLMVGR